MDDPPAVGILADDHAEIHGEGGAVAETEVDRKVAEHQIRVSISLNPFVPRSLTSYLPAISLAPRTCRVSTDHDRERASCARIATASSICASVWLVLRKKRSRAAASGTAG